MNCLLWFLQKYKEKLFLANTNLFKKIDTIKEIFFSGSSYHKSFKKEEFLIQYFKKRTPMQRLRELPKIDKIVLDSSFDGCNKKRIAILAKEVIETLRSQIKEGKKSDTSFKSVCESVLKKYHSMITPSLKPLINATGIILHTNLGRAPLHVKIFESAKDVVCGYSNLEYNQDKGCRGERYTHVAKQISELLGVEDALVVNNNASAVFLVLNTFANKKEAIVSRGELVEIGGSFRIPDVMKSSGCTLVEVGTTNKTKIQDYTNAITKKTAMVMKVHKSNFSIQGFSEEASYEDIVRLAKKKGIIDFYDAGGAYIHELPPCLQEESLNLKNILANKPSLVSFSGDKLIGSVQAGIIVGKKELISKLKKNQLLRMLRVDKVTLSLLEATITTYLQGKYELIPSLQLLDRSTEELEAFGKQIQEALTDKSVTLVQTKTYMGGGTMPNKTIPSIALHVKGEAVSLERVFREHGVVGRIENEQFLLDLRSVQEKDVKLLVSKIEALA